MDDITTTAPDSIAQADEGASQRFAHTVDGIAALAEQLSASQSK